MCMICVDFQKGLLTIDEAKNILAEMDLDFEHWFEVREIILSAEESE